MAISYRQESLGDYAKTASDFATQAAPSAFSPEVGFTSNAYVNPLTGKAYTPQDIIGNKNPSSMINVPYGQDFMSQWGWTLPLLGAAGAALAAPASGAAGAAEAGGAGAGAGGTAGAVQGVGAGMSSADAAAAYGSAGGITTGSAATDATLGLSGGGAAALGVPAAATGAASPTGAPAGSTGAVGAEQAPAPVSGVSVPGAGGPAGVSTGAAHVPVTGGGGVTGIPALDSSLSKLQANWLPLLVQGAGLAISAGSKGVGGGQMPNQAQFQGMGETASNAAIQSIQQAQAGQLSGPQQASLDQYIQEAKNQVRQYFSSIGQYDSTERIKAEQQVDQQAMAMKTQLIQQTMQNGISLIGAANTPLQTVANYQLGQDQQLQQAIGRFVSGAGTILGSNAGTPQTKTP